VKCIEKSALAANELELVEVCEANVQFTIFERALVDARNATAVRCFGEGDRVVVSQDIRIIGHMCFSKVKLGLLNFEPDSELTLPEG
jgi:hypothetical protein